MTQNGSSGSSLRQLALLIGVSEKAVRKAKAAGVFSARAIGINGKGSPVVLDVGQAVDEWKKSGRPLRGSARRPVDRVSPPAPPIETTSSNTAAGGPAPAEQQTLSDDVDDEDAGGDGDGGLADPLLHPTLVDAQRAVAFERAKKLRLENEVKEGKLLEVDRASREAFEFARIVREGLQNIPARLSAQLAGEPDESRVFALLDGALREALAAIATTLEARPADQDPAANVPRATNG